MFIDEGKKSYAALDFKAMSWLEIIPSVISSAARAAQAAAKSLGLRSNLEGDKYQKGGCLVVEKGGGDKPLLHYIQKSAHECVKSSAVLKALGIEGEAPAATPVQQI